MENLIIKKKNYKKFFVVKKGETVNMETWSDYKLPGETGVVEIRAVVEDGGVLNLKGMIKINKRAFGVDAFLRQKVLLLGENARAVVEPQLEILCNDVKASHAASVGQVDMEQVFYLMSKGFTKEESVKMIVEAFLNN